MVSKIFKKSPVKSIKDRRNKRWKKTSPIKSATTLSSIVSASINTCHRRIVKIFSKLSHIGGGTPAKKSPKKHGYKVLPQISSDIDFPCRTLNFCRLPLPKSEKRTIFLDLDETLIHSTSHLPNHIFDFIVRPIINGVQVKFYVSKRPFVDELLETLSQKFELVIFTAGLEEYASLVLD
ncbi:CTD nuclear envelope phosphatase 1 homolog, partial [Impatiens glandulifera]|uniref:CTD nuclear envelope phosphatase 1 homolog n=1 Tax=Impatiens glandulifera TaxID=253017 RepID=UPI001FB0B776